jgi:DNA adenine methylase
MPGNASSARVPAPLKWHGGKRYLARRIVALMPPHAHYVEPYAGGLAVLFAKPCEGVSEVVNDLNGQLTTFWTVLQDRWLFARFRRLVTVMPLSEVEWVDARSRLTILPPPRSPEDMVRQAVWFFVLSRQSLGGRLTGFTPLTRTRSRGGMNEQASAWLSAVEGLPAVHARLKRVVILNRSALDVLRTEDGPDSLHFCDPPYLPSTRTAPHAYGRFDMTEGDHRELLERLRSVQGKVMLSGYPSRLYDTALAGWTRYTFDVPNHAAMSGVKGRRIEVVWCNF